MKQSDSLLKQLFVPVVAFIGLVYLSWQMIQDAFAQGTEMTLPMWISIGVMILGAILSAYTAWKRYQLYQELHAEEEIPIEEPQPKVEKVPFVPTGDMKDGADAFARVIIGNRELLSQFKKATYPGTFESFCCQMEEPIAYLGDPEETETMAQMVLDRLEQNWKEEKKKTPHLNDQILISVYFVPALVYTRNPAAVDFAEAFHACWKTRYPKSVFQIGTYEDICTGFEKRFGCFITTAVCQSQGKADDCYELTQFRHYRDNWLANQPDGQALIDRYYEIAPSIVNIINLQANAPAVYSRIKETYLNPCLKAIEQGDNQGCLDQYQTMVEELGTHYFVS